MKNTQKKLLLSRETVRSLTDDRLAKVQGGGWTDGWCINLTIATDGGACKPVIKTKNVGLG